MRELLSQIKERRITLSTDGKEIVYQAPRGTMTPELLEAIKAHKSELIELLSAPGVVGCLRCPASALWGYGDKQELYCFSFSLFFPVEFGKPQLCEVKFSVCKHKGNLDELISRYRQ